MSHELPTGPGLAIAPLGAGDLIDRSVRFYRNNFGTFLLIAAPPVVVGTLISAAWMLAARNIFAVGPGGNPDDYAFYYLFISLGSLLIWTVESIATLVVMGGASRNFVRHLLFGEPITFRETYRNTLSRLASLIVASTVIVILLGILGIFTFYIGLAAAGIAIILVASAFSFLPSAAFIVSLVVGLAITIGALWVFFLAASRVAYVPQVMLVEGLGIFSAVSRSAGLAGFNVKRLAALFLFTLAATYSALALLYVPLAWYGWVNGVEFFTFDPDAVPAWYEMSYQLISQLSLILLSPVWMIGLCLLYVDERVRREGYDLELMAARRLGEIPAVPSSYLNPLQPALGSNAAALQMPVPAADRKTHSMLGLDQ